MNWNNEAEESALKLGWRFWLLKKCNLGYCLWLSTWKTIFCNNIFGLFLSQSCYCDKFIDLELSNENKSHAYTCNGLKYCFSYWSFKSYSEIHSWTVLLVVEIVPANFFQIRGLSFLTQVCQDFRRESLTLNIQTPKVWRVAIMFYLRLWVQPSSLWAPNFCNLWNCKSKNFN